MIPLAPLASPPLRLAVSARLLAVGVSDGVAVVLRFVGYWLAQITAAVLIIIFFAIVNVSRFL